MSAEPYWFGPSRRFFGFMHWPAGACRGGVVVCPPVAYEGVGAHRSLRLLAERLASMGLACLRVSYPGMGYGGPIVGDGDQLQVWRDVVESAAAELRGRSVPWVGACGLRIGASVALDQAHHFDAIVAWDPVMSGRRFVRGLQLLGAVGRDQATVDEGDGSLTVAGVRFSRQTLSALRTFSPPPAAGDRPLLLVRRPTDPEDVAQWPPRSESLTLDGTAEMIDVDVELSRPAVTIVERIAGWIGREAPVMPISLELPAADGDRHDGSLLRQARRSSSGDLFTMRVQRSGSRPSEAVLFMNNGRSLAIGPGGAWLEWADAVAASGRLAVLVDLSGLGESDARAGCKDDVVYMRSAGDDIAEVIEEIRGEGVEKVTVIGLCSGGMLAFDAAVRTAFVDAVIAINPRLDKPYRRVDRGARAGDTTNDLLSVPLSKSRLFPLFRFVPASAWRGLAALRLVGSPEKALERTLDRGTRITLVFGPDEWGLVALQRRSPRQWSELLKSPSLRLLELPQLDHSMFSPAARAAVEAGLAAACDSPIADPSSLTNKERS